MASFNPKVAYFSMEVGIDEHIPTYSGGLGILAGDYLKAAADLGLPMIGVSILYNKGYFTQKIVNGWQNEDYPIFDPSKAGMRKVSTIVEVPIQDRNVKVGAWLYEIKGIKGHKVPVLFLYTPDDLNANYDAEITDNLYRADDYYWRICQEAVLGIGGMRMLEARNYKPEVVHVNEGHGAFAPVELANILKNEEEAKARTIFTTHTPVPAGHDVFPAYKVEEVLHKWLNKSLREEMAPTGNLNMTQVALKRSRYVNAVAKRHAEVSAEMDIFKGTTVDYITNGVHSYTWTSPEFQKLFDRKIPEWRNDPANLSRASGLSLSSIIHAHHAAKLNLIEYVRERTDVSLDPDILTIGFARRFAGYKRADLIFDDPKMLLEAVDGDIQMVFAGKAHPNDGGGKQLIKRIKDIAQNLRKRMNVVFLDNYGMGMSSKLVSGVDIWLNTPERGREASGTSGMKAAHNGVPQISTDDGWWSEANGGGWTIGPLASSNAPLDRVVDAQDLYAKLKKEILPVMLNHTKAAEMSREAIARNASQFNCHRMLKEYVEKAYWPGVKTQLGTPEEDEEQAR